MQNRRYPPLSFELAKQLLTIEATGGLYRPCMVTLQDGTVLDRVYLAEARRRRGQTFGFVLLVWAANARRRAMAATVQGELF